MRVPSALIDCAWLEVSIGVWVIWVSALVAVSSRNASRLPSLSEVKVTRVPSALIDGEKFEILPGVVVIWSVTPLPGAPIPKPSRNISKLPSLLDSKAIRVPSALIDGRLLTELKELVI